MTMPDSCSGDKSIEEGSTQKKTHVFLDKKKYSSEAGAIETCETVVDENDETIRGTECLNCDKLVRK